MPLRVTASGDHPVTPLRVFFAVWLVLLCFLNPLLESSMAWNMLDLATSLADLHTLELTLRDLYGGIENIQREGRYYSIQPPAPSVLAAALLLLYRVVVGRLGPRPDVVILNLAATLLLVAPATAATTALLFARLQRRGFSPPQALGWAAALPFATFHLFLSSGFYKEALGTFFLFWSYGVLQDSGPDATPWRDVAAGVMAGWAVCTMYILFFPALLLVWSRPAPRALSRIVSFFAGAGVMALALLAYNAAVMGDPRRVSYTMQEDYTAHGFIAPSLVFLFTLLLGLRGGVLLYQPVLLLALAAIVWAGLCRRLSRQQWFGLSVFGSLLPMAALALAHHEGENPSVAHVAMRYLAPAVPFLLLSLPQEVRRAPRWIVTTSLASGVGMAFLFAQAGLVPSREIPGLYVGKVFATTLGALPLLSEGVPRLVGLATLRSAAAARQVTATMVWSPEGWAQILPLVLTQLGLAAASLALLAAAGYGALRILGVRAAWSAPVGGA